MSAEAMPLPERADAPRAQAIFRDYYQAIACRTDRLLLGLMILQWAAGIGAAIVISPRAWAGLSSRPHPNILIAVFLGGLVVSLPVYLAHWHPGRQITRHVLAASQMIMSALFIHLSGGRIETHFHVFGSLAFLSFYRDWRVLATASAVTALDHFGRGMLWPESVYGVLTAPVWRAFEHVGWVGFEDVFLLISIRQSIQEMHKIATRQAALETTNVHIEHTVTKRTAELTREIAERRRAEVALQESRYFLRCTVDALSAQIAILDEKGVIIETNQAWQRFARENGGGECCSVGENYLGVCTFPPGEASPAAEGIRSVMAGQIEEFSLEYSCHSPAEQRWFIMRASRFTNSSHPRVVVAHENITARKLAEEELSRSRSTLRGVLDHIPQRVFWKDSDLVYLGCNRALAADLGLHEPSDLVGKTDFDLHSEDLAQSYRAADFAVMQQDQARVAFEEPGIRPDGSPMWLRTSKVPLHDEAGRISGVLGTYEDVTAHKLAKLEIERLDAQLVQAQRLETIGKLASGVAHEFNTIMTAIIGQSELLLSYLPTAGSPRKSVTEIRKAAERAASLTRQLLAYGRKQMLRPEILDLNTILAGLTASIRHLLGGNIEIRLLEGAGLHPVRVDADQIEQVIINLAMNAADAMPQGGRLTIETANATLLAGDLGDNAELKPGEYICLSISDTGTGMTETVKAHLFEPFYTTKEVGQGTGLGLSTCYGIIKQTGGHISVRSEPGQGATFKIHLPRFDGPAANATPAAPAGSTRGREVILFVEADPVLRNATINVLRKAGYAVEAAADASAALNVAGRMPLLDLLITEGDMPGMSGTQLRACLFSDQPALKTLFTSTRKYEACVRDNMVSAGDEFLPKPYSPVLLLQRTREVLDRADASQCSAAGSRAAEPQYT